MSIVPRRALLYMPGDSERFLKKAAGLDVDCVCMDCEDAVAPDSKVECGVVLFVR
jgi:citrate lyase beta subunit